MQLGLSNVLRNKCAPANAAILMESRTAVIVVLPWPSRAHACPVCGPHISQPVAPPRALYASWARPRLCATIVLLSRTPSCWDGGGVQGYCSRGVAMVSACACMPSAQPSHVAASRPVQQPQASRWQLAAAPCRLVRADACGHLDKTAFGSAPMQRPSGPCDDQPSARTVGSAPPPITHLGAKQTPDRAGRHGAWVCPVSAASRTSWLSGRRRPEQHGL